MKPIVLENILNSEINNYLINVLSKKRKWQIVSDNLQLNSFSKFFSASDGGLIIQSYHIDQEKHENDEELNFYAKMIADIVINKCFITEDYVTRPRFNNVELTRFFWNYYHGNSYGVEHNDHNDPNYYSIIYYLNTVNGGTTIYLEEGEEIFEKSQSGKAVLFPAHYVHFGSKAPVNEQRFVLNILFKNLT